MLWPGFIRGRTATAVVLENERPHLPRGQVSLARGYPLLEKTVYARDGRA